MDSLNSIDSSWINQSINLRDLVTPIFLQAKFNIRNYVEYLNECLFSRISRMFSPFIDIVGAMQPHILQEEADITMETISYKFCQMWSQPH